MSYRTIILRCRRWVHPWLVPWTSPATMASRRTEVTLARRSDSSHGIRDSDRRYSLRSVVHLEKLFVSVDCQRKSSPEHAHKPTAVAVLDRRMSENPSFRCQSFHILKQHQFDPAHQGEEARQNNLMAAAVILWHCRSCQGTKLSGAWSSQT